MPTRHQQVRSRRASLPISASRPPLRKLTRLKDLASMRSLLDKSTYQADYTKLQQEISTALAEKQATRATPEAVQNLILHADDIRKIYATMDASINTISGRARSRA